MTFRAGCKLLAGWAVVLGIMIGAANSQEMKQQVMTFDANELFLIPGIGAGIVPEDGNLVVKFIPPADSRGQKFKDVDLREGDQIVMIEGSKVTTIDELRAKFEEAEIDSEIRLGIRRGKDLMICPLVRVEEEAEGGGQVMMVTRTMDGADAGEEGNWLSSEAGGPEDVLALADAGLILISRDEGLIVMGQIPGDHKTLEGESPEDGDRILEVAGQTVETADEFTEIYEATGEGEKIALTYLHGSDTLKCSFVRTKLAASGTVKVKQ